jgi:hypothetical protein
MNIYGGWGIYKEKLRVLDNTWDMPWLALESVTLFNLPEQKFKKSKNMTWHVTLCRYFFADMEYDYDESYFGQCTRLHWMWLLIFLLLIVMFLWVGVIYFAGLQSLYKYSSHLLNCLYVLRSMTWWSDILGTPFITRLSSVCITFIYKYQSYFKYIQSGYDMLKLCVIWCSS